MSRERLSLELKHHGYSSTKPRQIVFDYLLSHGPVSMNVLTKGLPGLDRATIYRTITLFETLGFTRRINLGWKYQIELSDTFTTHHHHLRCSRCGKIVDILDNPSFDTGIAELAHQYGFQETSHELEIAGLCPACLAIDS